MVINRGEIWWADLPEPVGSGPGYRRPVLVVQDNDFTNSSIKTVIVAGITSNIGIAKAKGNVLLSPQQSGLSKDSVINVSQLLTLDRSLLIEHVSDLSESKIDQVNKGLRLVLSL
ncbi:MAG: type II toxin-antitoxin system PemK/MazF family toxin [Pyrinomonadaceae bacterium]